MLTKPTNKVGRQLDLANLHQKTFKEIEYLQTYIEHISDSIEIRNKDIQELMRAEISKRPEEESVIIDMYEGYVRKVISHFYHSAIVLIYTTLESNLSNICLQIESQTSSKLQLGHIKDNNISNKSMIYLSITCDINTHEFKYETDRIKNFQKLRNAIVHQGSTFKNEKERVSITTMFPQIETDEHNFYISSNELLDEFIKCIKYYFKILFIELMSKEFLVKKADDSYLESDIEDELPF
ncbi:hypothetical protein FT669_17530 [Aeromonas jandaei]|uniref:hypothetical protein n=1 Tax=Aeromonas jandaei TaxID=650 RepID=UPI0016243079|nr:hypothetical protein FT669_17530 [Aeromonas jandaei]